MKTLCTYAMTFLGTNYLWGGDDPMKGYDCSGLVQEILASVGMDPRGDQTAQALYDHFSKDTWPPLKVVGTSLSTPQPGALVFYGRSNQKISHVAFAIDAKRVVEAGGGNSKTVDAEVAAKQNAYIRQRPYDRRTDIVAIILPNYYDKITEGDL